MYHRNPAVDHSKALVGWANGHESRGFGQMTCICPPYADSRFPTIRC
ncbi:hypothetical protein [Moorena sp. SIO3B2]|nr:hypothetical protein [Moorena sp. SIO3B2]NEP36087.1 hypothetical protein [Moorena sp. SIO3B2]